MNDRERVEKDIEMFKKNLSKYHPKGEKERKVVDMAMRYFEDAKFYLRKGDIMTAFGCINYAHGLIDALIKLE